MDIRKVDRRQRKHKKDKYGAKVETRQEERRRKTNRDWATARKKKEELNWGVDK